MRTAELLTSIGDLCGDLEQDVVGNVSRFGHCDGVGGEGRRRCKNQLGDWRDGSAGLMDGEVERLAARGMREEVCPRAASRIAEIGS